MGQHIFNKHVLVLACGSIAALATTASNAQQIDDTKNTALEEVVVVAQKREQSIQDVPVSIKVVSGDVVENLSAATGFDIVQYLPGFGIDDNREIRTTTLKTRGIGTFTNSIGLQSSNLIAFDGEILPRQSMLNLGVSDIERVEALRGPQGTLFGQNTSTGLIHYVTKRPKLDTYSGKVRAEFTRDNGQTYSGMVNLPIGSNQALRINGQYKTIDGWIDNTHPGFEDYKIGEEEQHALRAQYLFDNEENFNALVRVESSERESNCCSQSLRGTETPANFGPPVAHITTDANGDPTVVESRFNQIIPSLTFEMNGNNPVTARNPEGNYGTVDNFGISTEINWDMTDALALTYQASYRDYQLENGSTFFDINFPVERAAFAGNEDVKLSQHEIRLSSFNNDRTNWVAGFTYYDNEGQRSEFRDGCNGGGVRRGVVEGNELIGCYGIDSWNAFMNEFNTNGNINKDLLVANRLLASGDFTTHFENTAVFGQIEHNITDWWDITLGGRWLREEGEATFSRLDLNTPADASGLVSFQEVLARHEAGEQGLVAAQNGPNSYSDTDTAFIYKVVSGFDINENIRLFANYSTGYKGASYFVTANTNPDDAENFPTKPEKTKNIELGLRTRFDRVLFNATLFDMTVEDYQVRAVRLNEDGSTDFAGYINANEARTKGLEADMVVSVWRDIEFIASYASFDAKYEDFSNAPVNCPRPLDGLLADRCVEINGTQFLDQSGLSFPNNAERQFLGTLKGEHEVSGDWTADWRLVYRYEGSSTQNLNELNQGLASNPTSRVWDLYLGAGDDNLKINFFVKNLFDKTYTTSQRTNEEGVGFSFFPRDWTRFWGTSIQYQF